MYWKSFLKNCESQEKRKVLFSWDFYIDSWPYSTCGLVKICYTHVHRWHRSDNNTLTLWFNICINNNLMLFVPEIQIKTKHFEVHILISSRIKNNRITYVWSATFIIIYDIKFKHHWLAVIDRYISTTTKFLDLKSY